MPKKLQDPIKMKKKTRWVIAATETRIWDLIRGVIQN